ncbi:MAG: phosphoglycerate mutase family protein [Flavobacteriales bacterium]|nr:phosphoglycerate mutase family protein [Flavobacteriales bacterium]
MARKTNHTAIRTRVIFAAMLLFMVGIRMNADAQESPELFTIYLVRHAEKQTDSNDPPLTSCGIQRSESLNDFLEAVPLDVVYSTDYKRTQSTAAPTARAQGLSIQGYSTQALDEMAEQLLRNEQDALVVGHSNTTGVLAGLLVGEEIGAFDESIYNRIYQVVISKDDKRLHVFHTAFDCAER